MNPLESLRMLAGARRAEGAAIRRPSNVSMTQMVAVEDSSDGTVKVDPGGLVISQDESQYVDVPTIGNVREGDIVNVALVGDDGSAKSPLVLGPEGGGDRQQEQIDAATEVANATAQHFWYDSSGAHVSTEAGEAEGEQNSLWNSLGMLFRKGANNLLALVTGTSPGVLIYDGTGNAAANKVASFAANLIELGMNSANAIIRMCGGTGTISVDASGSFVMSYGTPSQTTPSFGLNGGWPGGVGDLAEMTVAQTTNDGESRATVAVTGESDGCTVHIDGLRIQGAAGGTVGLLRPIGIYSVTMTTQPSDGADATVYFGSGPRDITVTDTDYVVLLAPEGQPNGFTHIEYVVSAKYVNGFRIHSYNDWTSAITQTVVAVVMHK